MNRYISEIKINDLYHLKDITIGIADPDFPHLVITGRNGSGKTVLLNAVVKFIDTIKSDRQLSFLEIEKKIDYYQEKISEYPSDTPDYAKINSMLAAMRKNYQELKGNVDVSFSDGYDFINDYLDGNFIIAFYQAARKTNIIEPKNPTKPALQTDGKTNVNLTSQLLNFLSDLKIQEALARNENLTEEADHIKSWIENFENILCQFFEDPNLKLKFNYKDYTFTINTQGKSFKFTELSDGFVAILDIVADLILKMQTDGTLSTEFNKPGIVLIDEVETHLHLQLQKFILPMLTSLFPNIQFIVTTHSPFVLSSLPNATAYDLEHQEPITNLSEFSYQALAEGYFGVTSDSNYARQRYKELEALLKKDNLTDNERVNAKQLIADYKKFPEGAAPELLGAYRQLEITYYNKIKELIGA